MKTYELIKTHKGAMEQMMRAGIGVQDVKYVEMYEEFLRMKGEGHKLTYIVAFLVDEYSVGQATVYRVIERFGKPVKV